MTSKSAGLATMAGQAARTRVRVKVCGITTPADAALAADAGVDAIGLNFYPRSPRVVSTEQAMAISRRAAGATVAVVGVFVDPTEAAVREALGAARLDILQFHGQEPAAFCRQFEHALCQGGRRRARLRLRRVAAKLRRREGADA